MRVWGERPQKSCVNVNSFIHRGFGLVLPGPTDRPTDPPKKKYACKAAHSTSPFFFFRRALLRSTDDGWDSRRGCLCVCVCGVEGRDLVQGGGLGSQKGGKVGNIDGESWTGVGSVGVY